MKTYRDSVGVATRRRESVRIQALALHRLGPAPAKTTRGQHMTGRLQRHHVPRMLDHIVGTADTLP